MDTEKKIVIFLSELDYQIKQIKDIYVDLKQKLQRVEQQTPAKEMVESAGYWMHNLYSAYEDLFKLVSGFWENNVAVDGDFHVNLLKRMILNIPDVRPPLLSAESYRYLNELRGFRHVFRHAYSYGLDDERVMFLLRKTLQKEKSILKDIKTFRSKVKSFV